MKLFSLWSLCMLYDNLHISLRRLQPHVLPFWTQFDTFLQLVVWVDPLDGTSEFTQGLLDHVTVLIGVAWKGKSIGGVIHQPYFNYQNTGAELGRTMWGLIGLGSTMNWKVFIEKVVTVLILFCGSNALTDSLLILLGVVCSSDKSRWLGIVYNCHLSYCK